MLRYNGRRDENDPLITVHVFAWIEQECCLPPRETPWSKHVWNILWLWYISKTSTSRILYVSFWNDRYKDFSTSALFSEFKLILINVGYIQGGRFSRFTIEYT